MKKILNIFICTAFVLLAAACHKTDEPILDMAADEGVLSLSISSRTNSEELPFELKIYRYANEEKSEKELVRKYTAQADIPQYVWLVKDNYMAQVKIGNRELASFTEKYYVGTEDFAIVPGDITSVKVTGYMVNVPVSIAYDATVGGYFDEYYTYVCASDSFVLEDAENGNVPTLKYTESGNGYFILPDNVSNLSWYFYGKAGDKVITKQGVIENPESRKLYTLQFKYSPDAPGSLFFSAEVDTNPELKHDKVPFSPDPTIKGTDFNADAPYDYVSGSRSYSIKALDKISTIALSYGATSLNLLDSAATYEGIAVNKVSDKEYTVTLSEPFFNTLNGGTQTISFNVKDASGGSCYQECVYNIAGALEIGNYDLWSGSTTFYAKSFSSENLTIGYRTVGGEWTMTEALTATATATEYSVTTTTTFTAGTTYEYALFAAGVQVGATKSVTTAAGNQIPEAGFEKWSTLNKAACPAADPNNLFWDTGNHPVASFNFGNLTVASSDVHAGSPGSTSAYMKSVLVNAVVMTKFAAGNLFVGRFVDTEQTTHGIVEFGREFNFNARPKAIRFWMKHNQGDIDQGSHETGKDIAKVYCCLTDRKFTCRTAYPETLFVPSNDTEGVLATAYWESRESHAEWTEYTLPIEYKDGVTTKPSHLVLTFTCSGYGDYFTGSTDSWMYVDDVEFVY